MKTFTAAEMVEAQKLYDAHIPDVLGSMAALHTAPFGDTMMVLDYKPDTYPGQDINNPVVEGLFPGSRANVNAAGVIAQERGQGEDRYLLVRDRLGARKATRETMRQARDHLAAGGDLAMVTRHEKFADIAFAEKMGSDFLYDLGYEARVQTMIVSEMAPRIGHNFSEEIREVPAMFTLQLLCNFILKSFPRTESTKAEIDKLPEADAELIWAAVGQHNQEMVGVLNEQLDQGGVYLGLAPTGTTKVVPKEDGGVELADLNDGTVGIMSHDKMRILVMLLDYDRDTPFAYLYPQLININDVDDANLMMEVLGAADTKGVTEEVLSRGDGELLHHFGGVPLGQIADLRK